MKTDRVYLSLIVLSMLLLTPIAQACTGFIAEKDGQILFGNNEDYNLQCEPKIAVYPADEGSYGRLLFQNIPYPFNSNNYIDFSGINDQGLCFDSFAQPPCKPGDPNEKPWYNGWFISECIKTCATVDEVIQAFDQWYHPYLEWNQILIADRHGDAAIIEGDIVIRKTGDYQVCTNFLHSNPDLGGYPCWRYDTAVQMLEDMDSLSVDYFRDICNAVHWVSEFYSTIYSQVYDVTNGLVYVYYNHDFEKVVCLNLSEELALGVHEYMLADLFSDGTNREPIVPLPPSGPTSGMINKELWYEVSTVDPDGDDLYYLFDWGDGTDQSWIGPFSSGETCEISHQWNQPGRFDIKVKAKDDKGSESEWSSSITVSLPKGKRDTHSLIFNFLQTMIQICNEKIKMVIEKIISTISYESSSLPIIPDDPLFDQQWSLHNTGQSGGTIDVDVNAVDAWKIETGSPDVTIAIIDSGIDFGHPDLAENLWENTDEIPGNGVDDDLNGYVDDVNGYDFTMTNEDTIPWDRNGHGTLLAGRIAPTTNNEIGFSGITWNCNMMPLQVIGDTSWQADIEDIVDAIYYATDNGARIIVMTFEGRQYNALFQEAITYAYDNGVLVVCAAGNEGTDQPRYPGAYDHVITVASIDHHSRKMFYEYVTSGITITSNHGEWVDIAAPGVEIYSTMPTYHVPLNDVYDLDQTYTMATGCCVTAPLVAGVAALTISKNPLLTPDEVYDIICGSVEPYDSEAYLGTGIVNAFKAVTAPEKPSPPEGPSSGKTGEVYTVSTRSYDHEGDQVFYMWDWGDGNTSEWLGPFDSNELCETQYTWDKEFNGAIRVQAKDINGGVSPWSDPLEVSIPKQGIIYPDVILEQV